jgi:hypothetical protein
MQKIVEYYVFDLEFFSSIAGDSSPRILQIQVLSKLVLKERRGRHLVTPPLGQDEKVELFAFCQVANIEAIRHLL